MSKKSLIKCLREIIGLFDLIAVGNILWILLPRLGNPGSAIVKPNLTLQL